MRKSEEQEMAKPEKSPFWEEGEKTFHVYSNFSSSAIYA